RHELDEDEDDLLDPAELGLVEWPELVVRDVEDEILRPIGRELVHVGALEAIEAPRNDLGVARHCEYRKRMALFFREKTKMIDPKHALPGRDQEMPVAERHYVLGTPLRPP